MASRSRHRPYQGGAELLHLQANCPFPPPAGSARTGPRPGRPHVRALSVLGQRQGGRQKRRCPGAAQIDVSIHRVGLANLDQLGDELARTGLDLGSHGRPPFVSGARSRDRLQRRLRVPGAPSRPRRRARSPGCDRGPPHRRSPRARRDVTPDRSSVAPLGGRRRRWCPPRVITCIVVPLSHCTHPVSRIGSWASSPSTPEGEEAHAQGMSTRTSDRATFLAYRNLAAARPSS